MVDSAANDDAARGRRTMNRTLFREMTRTELENGPLGWLRRRTLVRFGIRLGIDPFEARLIVRAVEYECGHAPKAAMDECDSPISAEFVVDGRTDPDDRLGQWMAGVAIVIAISIGLGFMFGE